VDKYNRKSAPGKEPEIRTLKNLKPAKSRSRKNKNEPRAMENRRDHKMRMRSQTRRPTPTEVRYGLHVMRKKRNFREPTEEVIKSINYWPQKGI